VPAFSLQQPLLAIRTVVGAERLRRSLLAYLLFNTAEWAVWVAMLVYAYDRGGVQVAAAVAVAQLLPAALLAPFAVRWAERWPRSTALALSYAVQAAAMLATFLLLRINAPPIAVFAFAVVVTVTISLSRPLLLASLPAHAVTPPQLTAANSVAAMIESVAVMLGPAAAALLLEAGSPATVFASFAASQLLAALLVGMSATHASSAAPETGHWRWREALSGLRTVARYSGGSLILSYVAVTYLLVGMADVLTVVFAFEVLALDASGPGMLIAAMGVGGIVGAALSVLLAGRRRLSAPTALALGVMGFPYAMTGLCKQWLAAVLLLAVAGAGKSFLEVATRTMLQRCVDDTALGRVFGVQEGLMLLALAVGSLVVPPLVGIAGPGGAFVLAGLVLPVLGLVTWTRLSRIDADAEPPPRSLPRLRAIPMFAHLPVPVIERLARSAQHATVLPGSDVVRQGDIGDRFHVVEQGQFTVTIDGRVRRTLGPGDCFGEVALMRRIRRTATVTAAAPSELWSIDGDSFIAAITGSPVATVRAQSVIAAHVAADEREREH
jgi:hypothetical protein